MTETSNGSPVPRLIPSSEAPQTDAYGDPCAEGCKREQGHKGACIVPDPPLPPAVTPPAPPILLSPDEVRELLNQLPDGSRSIISRLAHTAAMLGEQREAMLAIRSATTLDLGAIRERAAAASGGPWHDEHTEFGCVHIGNYGWVASGPEGQGPEYDVDSEQGKADAEFIAHARTDIPDLLAEIDRLNALAGEGAAGQC